MVLVKFLDPVGSLVSTLLVSGLWVVVTLLSKLVNFECLGMLECVGVLVCCIVGMCWCVGMLECVGVLVCCSVGMCWCVVVLVPLLVRFSGFIA